MSDTAPDIELMAATIAAGILANPKPPGGTNTPTGIASFSLKVAREIAMQQRAYEKKKGERVKEGEP